MLWHNHLDRTAWKVWMTFPTSSRKYPFPLLTWNIRWPPPLTLSLPKRSPHPTWRAKLRDTYTLYLCSDAKRGFTIIIWLKRIFVSSKFEVLSANYQLNDHQLQGRRHSDRESIARDIFMTELARSMDWLAVAQHDSCPDRIGCHDRCE